MRGNFGRRAPGNPLALGGWANPHRHPERQVEFLQADDFTGEYYLTQVVPSITRARVERFLGEASRRGLRLPGIFGVFYYRSARRRTLDMLAEFMPVPVDELVASSAPVRRPRRVRADDSHAAAAASGTSTSVTFR